MSFLTRGSTRIASLRRLSQNHSLPSKFIAQSLPQLEPTVAEPPVVEEPPAEHPSMTGAAVPIPGPSSRVVNANLNGMLWMMSLPIPEVQKPVASGSGVTCSIMLAEPNVFLSGFDQDHPTRRGGHTTSALLRGKLQLNISKTVKIKSVTLKLVGKTRIEWPQDIPPHRTRVLEEQTLRTQSLVFFHAMHQGMWDTEYGNQCTYSHKTAGLVSGLQPITSNGSLPLPGNGRGSAQTTKEYKRLPLQSVNSRSSTKGDHPHINQVQSRSYKKFQPGTYEYTFELPIDHNQLETVKLQYGSVRWDLEMTLERAGAFKPNLHGTREVLIVRLPDEMSLETVEPISISRYWEDQLHFDIIIAGKSFPIGGKIPIAFKLTPLAKVQVHKLKVFVTENIEYRTSDGHETRKTPGRKLLLLEKAAGKPLDKQFGASDVRVLCSGKLEPDQREEARRTAARCRMRDERVSKGMMKSVAKQNEKRRSMKSSLTTSLTLRSLRARTPQTCILCFTRVSLPARRPSTKLHVGIWRICPFEIHQLFQKPVNPARNFRVNKRKMSCFNPRISYASSEAPGFFSLFIMLDEFDKYVQELGH